MTNTLTNTPAATRTDTATGNTAGTRPDAQPSDDDVASFADKVFGDLLGALSVSSITIGVRLGWYEQLATNESQTAGELSAGTDTDERYAREWLEQQTVAGYLTVLDPTVAAGERRYSISGAAADVLANPESLSYMAPFADMLSALGANLDHLVEAYRTGDGFGWHQHGDGARYNHAAANRPLFMRQLGEHLASIDDIHSTLTGGGRVADVGCGLGWSSIGVALAYPDVTVDGYDIDEPSVDGARINAADSGVADRVHFHAVDAGTVEASGYDLALALECIHDMPDPVAVLTAMRSMVTPHGSVIVMDERVGEEFTGDTDPVEQLMYGFSLICCLPDGRNAPGSAATGTVMRQPTFERYARDAGFSVVEVLPIDHDFFRFYRLTP